ncbi:MAG: glutamate--tRNA ligase, partial [Hyphomicrobiaceae bacterium]
MSTTDARPVVTRFAPSPTGFLHIGGARTALFNWLYAKHTGGRFLLRIEDTDRERSTDAATRAIIDGLGWLGLQWDGEVVYQNARGQRHAEVARELLARGSAYLCFMTPEEIETRQAALAAEREAAKKEGRAPSGPQRLESPWRDRDPAEAPQGARPVIRLKVPCDGETVVDDQVQGRVVFQNQHLDDMIVLRSYGTPVYNLAVVVDDHDMAVTHVIRGVDHLTNAARQSLIYRGMGWEVPSFAHVPLIHGPDGAKLSKRHGAQGVVEYRAMGYLPAALRNYL